jgi:hypothetical protein
MITSKTWGYTLPVNAHNQQSIKLTIWAGEGALSEDDLVTCPLARFRTLGIRSGDIAVLKAMDYDSDIKQTTVLQVEGEDYLRVGSSALPGPDGGPAVFPLRVMMGIMREVMDPCPVCQGEGKAEPSDHGHCLQCRVKTPADGQGSHCDACVLLARQALVKSNVFTQESTLLRGKLKAVLKAKTVGDHDKGIEWQDHLLIAGGYDAPSQYVIDLTAKAMLALAIVDDGNGSSPSALVDKEAKLSSGQEIEVMMKAFATMPDAVYRVLLSRMHRIDTLVEDACRGVVIPEPTEEEVLELADRIFTSKGQPIYGRIPLWDGLETVTVVDPPHEALQKADDWASEFIKSCREDGGILEGRARDIAAQAKVAACFRGDSKASFDENSDFMERLAYVQSLPKAVYYLYLNISGHWKTRCFKATEPDTLGNS